MNGYYATQSGVLIPEHAAIEMALAGCRPTAVDLFCGCGGFSLGFIQAGYEVLAGVDNDVDAAITYTSNLGAYPLQFHFATAADRQRLEKSLSKKYKKADRDQLDIFETSGSGWISSQMPRPPGVSHFFLGDICALKGRDILDAVELEVGELDSVIGSPPCQGFSRANRQRTPDDPRNELLWEYARLVCEMKPKTLCLENVPEMATTRTPDGFLVLDVFTRILEDGGFAGVDSMRAAMKQQAGITLMRSRTIKKTKAKKKCRPDTGAAA